MEFAWLAGTVIGTGASAGYVGYTGYNYFQFRKFVNSGYSGDLRLLSGQIHAKPTGINFPFGVSHSQVVETTKNSYVFKEFHVHQGIRKKGYYTTYVKVGKSSIPIQHSYYYTDWNHIFGRSMWAENLTLGKIALNINDKKPPELCRPFNSVKLTLANGFGYINQLNLNNQVHHKATKFNFEDRFIDSKERVTVIGRKTSNKSIEPLFIGNRDFTLKSARRGLFSVKGGPILSSILVGSGFAYLSFMQYMLL